MTSLGNPVKIRKGDFIIYLSVSGDLSHSYNLVTADSERDGYIGVGISFPDITKAKKYMEYGIKHGWKKLVEKYKEDGHPSDYNYGYLSYEESKPFLRGAYGEKAEEYRKKEAHG